MKGKGDERVELGGAWRQAWGAQEPRGQPGKVWEAWAAAIDARVRV